MVDGSTQKGIYKIRSDCETTIKTLQTHMRVSEDLDLQLSDFVRGQLKGAIDQLERIKQMAIDIIAERSNEEEN